MKRAIVQFGGFEGLVFFLVLGSNKGPIVFIALGGT